MFFLEDRSIPPNAVHDSADTVEANPFAQMLNKCSRISVASNKATNRVLHLNGHLLLSFSCAFILHYLSAMSRGSLQYFSKIISCQIAKKIFML